MIEQGSGTIVNAATIGAATGAGADAVREQVTAGIPTGRFTAPREVATLVTMLASARTANVNGSDYVIDGAIRRKCVRPLHRAGCCSKSGGCFDLGRRAMGALSSGHPPEAIRVRALKH